AAVRLLLHGGGQRAVGGAGDREASADRGDRRGSVGVTADLPARVAPAPPARIAGVQLVARGADVVAVVALKWPLRGVLRETTARDPDPADGSAVLAVAAAGTASLSPATLGGVTLHVVPRGRQTLLRLRTPPGRFFALSYTLVLRPAHLVVRLWSVAPPVGG